MNSMIDFTINPLEIAYYIFKKTCSIMKNKHLSNKYIKEINNHFIRYQNEIYYNELTKFITTDKIKWVNLSIGNLNKGRINYIELYKKISMEFYDVCNKKSINILPSESELFFYRLFRIIISYKLECLPTEEIEQLEFIKILLNEMEYKINDAIKQIYSQLEKQIILQNEILGEVKLNLDVVIDFRRAFAEEYQETLFLKDRDLGCKLKLSDLYIPPKYTLNGSVKEDILGFLNDFVDNRIDAQSLLISGEPAVGKSSLIRRFINDRIYLAKEQNIIVVPMKDLTDGEDLAITLCNKFSIGIQNKSRFLSNKIIILDGYDEYCFVNSIEDPNKKYDEIIKNICAKYSGIKGTKIIITTRSNYVKTNVKSNSIFITLEPFDKEQISDYIKNYNAIQDKNIFKIDKETLKNTEEILAIPMILYMVVALNISLDIESSKAQIYDEIFGDRGALINNKHNSNTYEIDYKEKFLEIPSKIAFEMFKNHNYKYTLSPNIAEDSIFEGLKEDEIKRISSYFGIMCYYKDNIFQTNGIEFIHKSLYEYFLAKYFWNILHKRYINFDEHLKSICSTFAWDNFSYIEMRTISKYDKSTNNNDILGFYKYFVNEYSQNETIFSLDNRIKQIKYVLEHDLFETSSYTEYIEKIINKKEDTSFEEPYKAINNYLKNIFSMYWNLNYYIFSQNNEIFEQYKNQLNQIVNSKKFVYFMKECGCEHFILANLEIRDARLINMNLMLADLSGCILCDTTFEECDLRGAILSNADLSNTNFIYADLINADLSKSNLENSCFSNACLLGTKFYDSRLYNTIFDDRGIFIIKHQFEKEDIEEYTEKNTELENVLVHDRTTGQISTYSQFFHGRI